MFVRLNSSSCRITAFSSCCCWSSTPLNMSWKPSTSRHSLPSGKESLFLKGLVLPRNCSLVSCCDVFFGPCGRLTFAFICSNTFHILRPTKAPGFVYAWLELISHRIFIARMLAHTPQQKVFKDKSYINNITWLFLNICSKPMLSSRVGPCTHNC